MSRNIYQERVLGVLSDRVDGVLPSELAKELGGSIHLYTCHLLALVLRGEASRVGNRFYPISR